MTTADSGGLLESGGSWSEKAPRLTVSRSIRSFFRMFLLDSSPSDGKLRPTAYLDGLRGFMAFLVYIHHNELWAHASSSRGDSVIMENGYGYEGNKYFATLPFVRNFFTGGHMAVAVFFVISGYVLSAKPLSLIIDGDSKRLLDNLASSVFRRWFRLYIPIIITTFVFVTSWHVPGYWVSNCVQQGSLVDEWWNWYAEFKNFSFVFKEGPIWVSYNTHLWSIPLEMRGSVVVFCSMLGLYRATHRARLLCMLGLIFYFLYVADGYYCALFAAGMLMCDLDLLAARNHSSYPGFLIKLRQYQTPLIYTVFVFGLFLAGVPSRDNDIEHLRASPLWYYLSFAKAQAVYDYKWFYLFYASVMITVTVPRIPLLKGFFESRFCQYLGRISYALYLVHGPVLASLGDRIYFMTGWVRPGEGEQLHYAGYVDKLPVPRIGPMGLELSFLVPHLVIAPATFFLANLVTKYVDEPAVRWPAMLYKYVQPAEDTLPRPETNQRLA